MNFKKRVNGSWVDAPNYIHNTSTDTLTTLPAIIHPTGSTATVGLKGNAVQSGTPTPSNPITPQGCGGLETVGTKAGQYKIPISSASTTTPIYLGEVETTRKIKKLVLTGSETLAIPNTDKYRVPIGINLQQHAVANNLTMVGCTHFIVDESSEQTITSENDFTTRLAWSGTTEWFFIPKSFFSGEISVSNCRSQFAELLVTQYAAGTPVTIWYVLAEPEIAVVNEPLMKIGDYADELSNVPIPVTAGGDTISVSTTVRPSEFAATWTGWHDTDVKEHVSDATIADWESVSIAQMENHTIQELQGGNWV